MSREDTLEVFVSYSHRDESLRDRLDTHLALLKRQEVIRTWFDGAIEAGQEIEPDPRRPAACRNRADASSPGQATVTVR